MLLSGQFLNLFKPMFYATWQKHQLKLQAPTRDCSSNPGCFAPSAAVASFFFFLIFQNKTKWDLFFHSPGTARVLWEQPFSSAAYFKVKKQQQCLWTLDQERFPCSVWQRQFEHKYREPKLLVVGGEASLRCAVATLAVWCTISTCAICFKSLRTSGRLCLYIAKTASLQCLVLWTVSGFGTPCYAGGAGSTKQYNKICHLCNMNNASYHKILLGFYSANL